MSLVIVSHSRPRALPTVLVTAPCSTSLPCPVPRPCLSPFTSAHSCPCPCPSKSPRPRPNPWFAIWSHIEPRPLHLLFLRRGDLHVLIPPSSLACHPEPRQTTPVTTRPQCPSRPGAVVHKLLEPTADLKGGHTGRGCRRPKKVRGLAEAGRGRGHVRAATAAVWAHRDRREQGRGPGGAATAGLHIRRADYSRRRAGAARWAKKPAGLEPIKGPSPGTRGPLCSNGR